MKSIASHARQQQHRLDQIGNASEADEYVSSTGANELAPSPEEVLILARREAADKEMVDGIMALFDDDLEAQMVLTALAEGLTGAALRDSVGITQTQSDYVMKRVRRETSKKYPKGLRR